MEVLKLHGSELKSHRVEGGLVFLFTYFEIVLYVCFFSLAFSFKTQISKKYISKLILFEVGTVV